ncbi:hypothetical protein [Actinomadura rubrisoli]|uniref:Uncharacterized protein n=1 Tax=Actinomadura rubrisoli TaxID=2530368 RepID=A0A4R5CJJ4_9ACTN|nr:hypothetical protein [Actinomadura rubrisoli]TDD97582.1 hypothetical protein E1298_00700 [Actinomadura rubrisoli]
MARDQLLAVIDDIRTRVANGDSFEGSIEYLMPENPGGGVDFDVRAGYRIGNSMGQGGFRLIAAPEADDTIHADTTGGAP